MAMPHKLSPFEYEKEKEPIDALAAVDKPTVKARKQDEPNRVAATFQIDADVKQQLRLLACITNESQQDLVNQALKELLGKHKRKLSKVA